MGAYRQIETRNTNEVYRNEFTTSEVAAITELTENAGSITSADPIGTVVLPQKCLDISWTSSGANLARIDLGTTYNELYVQFYINIINDGGISGVPPVLGGAFVSETRQASQDFINLEPNHTTGDYYRWFLNVGGINLKQRFTFGQWNMIGLHCNRTTQQVTRYLNGRELGTSSANDKDLQWILFGGNLPSGYRMQVASLTVNTTNFSAPVSNLDGIGEDTRIYVDYSMDSGIDASNFTGLHKEPFDPNGGTSYIDGALRYSGDFDSNFFEVDKGKILYKSGVTSYLEDLATSNGVKILGSPTSATENYTIGSYDSGSKPKITNGIIYSGAWTLDDAPNNVYRSDVIANFSNLSGIRFQNLDTSGVRESTNLSDFDTYSGIYYKDTDTILVKMWDESNPTGNEATLKSNVGYDVNDYTNIKNVHFYGVGLGSGDYSKITYCEFSKGGSLTLDDYAEAMYNRFYDNWAGGQYQDTTLGGKTTNLSVGNNSVFSYNYVDDGYFGIEAKWGTKNPLISFNVFNNIIVNTITLNGTNVAHVSSADAIKVINNTVFASPRHATDIPYPMAEASTGHGLVLQGGGDNNWVEAINNLYLLHYNHNNLPGTGIGNCYSGGGNATITMDYNLYYKSSNCDTHAKYFTSGDDDSFTAHQNRLNTGSNTGVGGIIESHSAIVTTLPVAEATQSLTSGKWLTTNANPTVEGNGTEYDFSAWGLVHDNRGRRLTSSRNIGSN